MIDNYLKPFISKKSHILRLFIALAVSAAAIYQANFLLQRRVKPVFTLLKFQSESSAFVRGARGLEGQEFSDYIKFLRSEIPADASVMLPPRIPVRPVAHVGLMQYFLFPREIHNCGVNEVEACIERIRDDSEFYVLGLADFPPAEQAAESRDYIPFDSTSGLYVPVIK
jgi:hypothetical protein